MIVFLKTLLSLNLGVVFIILQCTSYKVTLNITSFSLTMASLSQANWWLMALVQTLISGATPLDQRVFWIGMGHNRCSTMKITLNLLFDGRG